MDRRTFFILLMIVLFIPHITKAQTVPTIHFSPQNISEGDPVMVSISGTTSLPVTGTPTLFFFLYKNVPTALYGVDLNQKTGTTTVTVTFKNGLQISNPFFVAPRTQPQESLAIPAQLGGNSVANQAQVVSQLSKDNAALALVYSRKDKALWTNIFSYPVATPVTVTDPYGYNRDSGAETIVHKGVDFHAPPGTQVFAINRGVVRVAKNYTIYGNTVIIDHGLGLLSMYMHLSKINVAVGQLVQKGELVGLSGETGYSEGPHLHLTVRINGISIDPIAFFGLFGVK